MSDRQWKVPHHVIQETELALRRGAHEVFAMWTASVDEARPVCNIHRVVVPAQSPGFSPSGGAYVHIEGTELSRIQFENYDRGERSVVQLHTHPGSDVRMSQLDRMWEVVKHVGALSIIVPSYAARGLVGFPGVFVYEREQRDWRLWSTAEIAARLVPV